MTGERGRVGEDRDQKKKKKRGENGVSPIVLPGVKKERNGKRRKRLYWHRLPSAYSTGRGACVEEGRVGGKEKKEGEKRDFPSARCLPRTGRKEKRARGSLLLSP